MMENAKAKERIKTFLSERHPSYLTLHEISFGNDLRSYKQGFSCDICTYVKVLFGTWREQMRHVLRCARANFKERCAADSSPLEWNKEICSPLIITRSSEAFSLLDTVNIPANLCISFIPPVLF